MSAAASFRFGYGSGMGMGGGLGAVARRKVMVRIPWSRIYRAFPELDRFSDQECERFVELAKRREWLWHGVMAVVALAAMVGVYLLVLNVWRAAEALLPGRWRAWIWGTPAALVVLGTLSLLSGPMAALLIRDAWLRRAIQRHIDLARCPKCEYSLLGLPVEAGCVQCPECGRRSSLGELGITEEQLRPGAATPS